MNLQHILVPTDFSDNAMKATELAISIAQKQNASVTLVHGYVRPQGGTSVMVKINDLIAKEARENLDQVLSDLKEKYPNQEIDGYTHYGYIDEVIQILTEDRPFDIIIMGTTGSDKIQNKVFGSNTSKMINKSAVPVLSVPVDTQSDDLKKMALAIELPLKNSDAIVRFQNIAKGLGVETDFVSVTLKNAYEDLLEHAKEVQQKHNIKVNVIKGEDFYEAMLIYITENNIDGICVLRKEYGFFESLFHKSKTKELAIYSNKPILAIDQ